MAVEGIESAAFLTRGRSGAPSTTMLWDFSTKSKQVILRHWYSTARVSKRLTNEATACLRARYCTDHGRNVMNVLQKLVGLTLKKTKLCRRHSAEGTRPI